MAIPASGILQKPDIKIADILHADTARRIEAHELIEIALLRRIVHVNGMLIVEVDLCRGHGVDLARILTEHQLHSIVGIPVYAFRRNFLSLSIVETDLVIREILRVLPHQRNNILLDDRLWRRPVRIENDFVNLGVKDRRLTVDLANNSCMALRNAAAFHCFNTSSRDVDHHKALFRLCCRCHAGQALEVGLQLAKTRIGIHIHCCIGKLAHHTISRKAVTRLEALDRCIDIGIERTGNTGFTRKIARNDQTLAQSLYRRIINAKLQLRIARNLWPATAACQIGILCDSGLKIAHSLLAEHWLIGCHFLTAGRAGIELVIPVAAAWRRKNIIQSLLLGKSRRSDSSCSSSQTGRCCATQEAATAYIESFGILVGFGHSFGPKG